jgi:hypothetical protein
MEILNFLNASGAEIVNLTQWDLGIKLYITNTWSYTDPPIFHFFNSKSDEALVQGSILSSGKIVVQVPNELLKYPYSISVHMDIEDTDGARTTVAKGILPVTPKAKPSYYEYVDNIRDVFADIIAEVLEGGSPKGVFSTVSGLSEKDSGLYVYTGATNTSNDPQLKNGYLYYWDKLTTILSYLCIVYQATQLDDNSVNTANIVDGSVTDAKLAKAKWDYVGLNEQGANVFNSCTAPGTIYTVRNSSNDFIFVTLGTTQIRFSNKYGLQFRRKTDDTWDSSWSSGIIDGSVTHAKLATDAVEEGNIKDGEVSFAKIKSNAVSKSTDSQTWSNANDTTLPTTQLTKEWINTEIANAAPVVFSYTLLAESWSSGQQSVTVPNGYTHSGEVSADVDFDTTTNSQLLADDCAGIYIVSNYSNSTLTLTAYFLGNAPTEDIDIQITLTPIQYIGE